MSLLSLSSLKAYYGESQALFDVNLEVKEGEIVALMGRNGTGKSTTVKSIFQMIETNGELLFSGKKLNKLKSFQISRLGIGLVPEGRRIFGQLSVRENLIATSREGRWNIDEINKLFPKTWRKKWSNSIISFRWRTTDACHSSSLNDQPPVTSPR